MTGDDAGPPEVKTLTFATLRTFLPRHFGEERYQQILQRLSAEARELLETAEPGDWALEAHMHEVMSEVYGNVLGADADAYMEFARALALAGINRFMRIFLSLASARFVLRRIPVVWNRLRRNAGTVTATSEGDVVRIHYAGFPFFSEPCYRLLSLANCQALVCAATKTIPAGAITSFTDDTLVLEFRLRDPATT